MKFLPRHPSLKSANIELINMNFIVICNTFRRYGSIIFSENSRYYIFKSGRTEKRFFILNP
jgi:hypothetical protein